MKEEDGKRMGTQGQVQEGGGRSILALDIPALLPLASPAEGVKVLAHHEGVGYWGKRLAI